LPDRKRIEELLAYDRAKGEFRWKQRRGPNAPVGSLAGTNHGGYRRIIIDRRVIYVHRLVWFMEHGAWPSGDIDHINHVKSDNRISNLRDISHAANNQHRKGPQSNNTSGCLGVWWHRQNKKWAVEIWAYEKKHFLGCYDNLGDAKDARRRGEKKFFREVVNA